MKTTSKPKYQQFQIEGVKHIDAKDAFDLIINNKAILIDVRTEQEYDIEAIKIDSILYYPMEIIIDSLDDISKEQNIILVCSGGFRSTKAANLLNINAYPNVANLDGGFKKWIEMKLPFEVKTQSIAEGCCCGSTSQNRDESCCSSSITNKSCC